MPESAKSGATGRVQVQPNLKRRGKPDQKVEFDHTASKGETASFSEKLLVSDYSQAAFEHHAGLLRDSRMSSPKNGRNRVSIARRLQRDYGDRYLQRIADHISRSSASGGETLRRPPLVQKAEQEIGQPVRCLVTPETIGRIDETRSAGNALEPEVRTDTESAFGQNPAKCAFIPGRGPTALTVNTQVFTPGNDVFFRRGSYDADTKAGKELLAHDLTSFGLRTSLNGESNA